MTINYNQLFTQLGAGFNLGNTLITAGGVKTDLNAFLNQVQAIADEIEEQAIEDGTNSAYTTYIAQCSSGISQMVSLVVERLIVWHVDNDTPLTNKTISVALDVLIDAMRADGQSLKANQPTITVTYGTGLGSSSGITGDNSGNGILILSTKREDGLVNEHMLPETITAVITAVGSDGTAVWNLTAQPSVGLTDVEWPEGSAVSTTLTSWTAAGGANIVTSGDFEDEDTVATNLPYGWTLVTGTLGTTIVLTPVEQQTVTITGTPTAGWYTLKWTDSRSRTYETDPLTYNASASTIQSALRKLPGLTTVTVSSTGTSPNYTHTVIFYDVPNPSELTSDNLTTGGTITHATTVAGSSRVVRGARCLSIVGNSSELTTLQVKVSVEALAQYAVNVWLCVDVVPAAGVLVVDLVDGVSGTVITDEQGTANTYTVNLTTLDGVPDPYSGVFRTPKTLPPSVYLRIRLTTALSTGSILFLDDLVTIKMTRLYTGGPFAAGVTGPSAFELDDRAEIIVNNAMSGQLHTWLNRTLNLQGNDILFPTVTNGSETQADSLIT